MDEQLIRYLLDDLSPEERATVEEHLATHPTDAAALARLRNVVAVLAKMPAPEPPPGLATEAIGRTAEYLVAQGCDLTPSEPEYELEPVTPQNRWESVRRFVDDPIFLGFWRRADLAVAFSIGLIAVGLGLGAVSRLRVESQVRGCQDRLRGLHTALVGYGEAHSGRFPQVGTPGVPSAGSLGSELIRTGQLWSATAAACPVAFETPAEFAYTLGYRSEGGVVIGVRRADGPDRTTDWLAVAADPMPSPHTGGQNVLYAGGTVRFSVTTTAGVNGDDIYRNDNGLIRAGLHRLDAALGTGAAVP